MRSSSRFHSSPVNYSSSLNGSRFSSSSGYSDSGSDYRRSYSSTRNEPASSSPTVEYTRNIERMRTQRESAASSSAYGSSPSPLTSASVSWRGSSNSSDRLGASSVSSISSPTSQTTHSSSFLRSRSSNFSPSDSSSTMASKRASILEETEELKPVVTSNPYSRSRFATIQRSRAPSTSESLYDYSMYSRTGYGTLPRRAFSRDSSFDRTQDVRSSSRIGRRTTQQTDSEEDDSTSVTVRIRPSASTNLPPAYSSYSSLKTNGYLSKNDDHYDNYSQREKAGILRNGSSLQRSESVSSLRSKFSSPTTVRHSRDLSVNFELGSGDRKRDISPVVTVLSRVAVEKDAPITRQPRSDLESRYVVSKFPVDQPELLERTIPIAKASDWEPKREASRERVVPIVDLGRNGVAPPTLTFKSNYARQDSRDSLHDNLSHHGRVIGGKAFPSDSSHSSSAGSDDESPTLNNRSSIIRAHSPPTSLTRRSALLARKTVNVDESDKAGLIGLKNLGNTCFMNSIIQALSNSLGLRDYCLSGEWQSEVNTTTSRMKGELISAFAAVMESLWKKHTSYSSTTPYVPDKFHRQIQQYAPRFSGYLQQDAQEFLRYLLEGLHEDVNRVTAKTPMDTSDIPEHLTESQKATESWKRYLKRDNSKIVDLFVGQLKSSLTCQSCGYRSVTYDPFWDLSLSIPGGNRSGRSSYSYSSSSSGTNIHDCFKLFTKEEVLDGDESPTCFKCKSKQKCTKFFTIQRFPRYLAIHLKRFSQERFRAKLSTLVEYPVEGLDLSEYAADSHTGPKPRYNLYGISCHSGSTHCGHYTAYCKHPVSGKWHDYNDARVSPVKVDDIVTSEAYLLFYELLT